MQVQEDEIIGGMFALEQLPQGKHSYPTFLQGEMIFYCNASSAINDILKIANPRRIWFPSYICESMLSVLNNTEIEVNYYDVGAILSFLDSHFFESIRESDVVFVVDYFGFLYDVGVTERIRSRGAWIVEDASQAFLSTWKDGADFRVLSPRKFLGVPDGGILVMLSGRDGPTTALEAPPSAWWEKSVRAGRERLRFDQVGGNLSWFRLFQEAEETAPVGRYAMSELSRRLLFENFDYGEIARRRRQNYRSLAQGLAQFALFPELAEGVVPLGFPIRLANRNDVRDALFAHGIYPPVHWPISGIVPERFRASHRLSNTIMTLPCDQRYGSSHMERIVRTLLDASPRPIES